MGSKPVAAALDHWRTARHGGDGRGREVLRVRLSAARRGVAARPGRTVEQQAGRHGRACERRAERRGGRRDQPATRGGAGAATALRAATRGRLGMAWHRRPGDAAGAGQQADQISRRLRGERAGEDKRGVGRYFSLATTPSTDSGGILTSTSRLP